MYCFYVRSILSDHQLALILLKFGYKTTIHCYLAINLDTEMTFLYFTCCFKVTSSVSKPVQHFNFNLNESILIPNAPHRARVT